jgi:ADP-ribosylglycohydrolase
MRKLSESWVEKGYAGLLGKVIGVRLGAPVESWSAERIAAEYGEVTDYLCEYRNFAADDDINGPLFFYRALLDYGLDVNVRDIGRTLLNYAPHEHGFFWWGGYGRSTEHTAYANLRAGLEAPRSGSISQNGPVVAEQIGGQIFSDCWGLVCPGNPSLAAEYARRAASVTHDGEGVYGGMFVAACIAAAFTAGSVREVLERGLREIPKDCLYARMSRDIMAFSEGHPENWRDCFRYIEENWGCKDFPGNVHIIPNAAIMIASLCYGGGKFGDTLCICNMCGWDTDCNAGNLGAVMGVLLGPEGIEDNWRRPLNDFVAASSVIGFLNILDMSAVSLALSDLACQIAGLELPEVYAASDSIAAPTARFELPGALHSFRASGLEGFIENTGERAHSGRRSLKISGKADDNFRLYIKTYYTPDDFSDSRYDPSFAPTAYPGAKCSAWISSAAGAVRMRLAAWGRDGQILCAGEAAAITDGWRELTLDTSAAPSDCTLCCIGLLSESEPGVVQLYLDDFAVSADARYTLDFSRERPEVWHRHHTEISQLSRLGGIWELLDGALWCGGADYCRAYTGHYDWTDYTVRSAIQPVQGEVFRLLGRVQGAERSYAAALRDGRLSIEKQDGDFAALASVQIPSWLEAETEITLSFAQNRIHASAGEFKVEVVDEEPYTHGCIGWSVEKGRMRVRYARIETA